MYLHPEVYLDFRPFAGWIFGFLAFFFLERGKSRVTFKVDYLDASRVWLLQQGMHGEFTIFPALPFQGSVFTHPNP